MNPGSERITKGIRIKVVPEYIPKGPIHTNAKNIFSYRITIINESEGCVKLLSRHWIIIDSEGKKEEVAGEGIVGYTPELKPGDSFTYSSFCPLDTDWGTMEGTYKLMKNDGTKFDALIERFYLLSPNAAGKDKNIE